MSFGKKGLAQGQAAPMQSGFGRAIHGDAAQANTNAHGQPAQADEIAAAREAFIASERARRAEETGVAAQTAAHDPMVNLRNSARPTAQPAQRLGDQSIGGGPAGSSVMSAYQEEEIRAAARSMAHNKPILNSRSGGSGSGYFFGDPASRNLGIAYLLWFVLGQLSLHRFYCGQKDSAFIQIGLWIGSLVILFIFPPLGLVGLVLWFCWLVGDLFMMPGMLRNFQAEHDPRSVFS